MKIPFYRKRRHQKTFRLSKKASFLVLLLLAGVAIAPFLSQNVNATGNIAYSNSWKCKIPSGTSCTMTIATSTGDTVIVAVSTGLSTVVSVTDNGGSVYVQRKDYKTTPRIVILATEAGLAKAATNLTITMSGSTKIIGMVAAYTNVAYISANFTISSGSGTNPSLTGTAIQSNDWIVGGFAETSGTAIAETGNLRQTDVQLQNSGSLVDNIATVPGPITISITHSATSIWAVAAIQLIGIAPIGVQGNNLGLFFFLVSIGVSISMIAIVAVIRRT